jgi:hypothetical protein
MTNRFAAQIGSICRGNLTTANEKPFTMRMYDRPAPAVGLLCENGQN